MDTELKGHLDCVECVGISFDDSLAVSDSFDKLFVYKIYRKTEECVYKGHNCTVYTVAISRNKEIVISRSANYTVCVWGINEKRLRK